MLHILKITTKFGFVSQSFCQDQISNQDQDFTSNFDICTQFYIEFYTKYIYETYYYILKKTPTKFCFDRKTPSKFILSTGETVRHTDRQTYRQMKIKNACFEF